MDLDLVHDTKEAINQAVHHLVDEMLQDIPFAEADLVRTQLTEQFRFWKQEQ